MTPPICAVCDYLLDARGRCADCARVLPKNLEQLKWQRIHWVECPRHGAVEAEDQRPVQINKQWKYACNRCYDEKRFGSAHEATTMKDIIVRRSEYIEEERARLLAAWGAPPPQLAVKEGTPCDKPR